MSNSTSSAKHTVGREAMFANADKLLAAYRESPRKYVIARRESAMLHAADPLKTDDQIAYWNRIADGCAAIAKAQGASA